MQISELMCVDFFTGRTHPARIGFRFMRTGDILSKGQCQCQIATSIGAQKHKCVRNTSITVCTDEALFEVGLSDDLSELHFRFFLAKIQRCLAWQCLVENCVQHVERFNLAQVFQMELEKVDQPMQKC